MLHKAIFNIQAGEPFLETFVAGLKKYTAQEFQSALILLPTRRACNALRDLFLEQHPHGTMLLPAIRQLSMVDEDELLLSSDPELAQAILDIPPAISSMRRRLLLTKAILARKEPDISHTQAFLLAADLGKLIDQVLIENCDFKNLEKIVDGDLAEHWQIIVRFLSIITDHWPAVLAEQGVIEAVDRRKRLIQLQINYWQKKIPDYPVIAAGSTGSHPSTAALLKAIASLPKSAVILPGLDQQLDEPSWQTIGPTHPQYLLQKLLKKLEVERDDVAPWYTMGHTPDTPVEKRNFLTEVMRPAEHSDDWEHLKAVFDGKTPWQGLQSITCQHEQEEALLAALMLRKSIEDGNKTVALITPDRSLGIRVATLLRRWNIVVDDSAGIPLSHTSLASFFTLLLRLPCHDAKPSDLMAFLKHPKTALGMHRAECLRLARMLEIDFFRKTIVGHGLKTWLTLLDPKKEYAALLATVAQELNDFPEHHAIHPFSYWLDKHLALANAWSKETPWQGGEGEVLADYMNGLRTHGADYPCSFEDYTGIFTQGLNQEIVRLRYGQHPNVHILGLIEVRMLSFDTIILAGLNEGTWPEAPALDPWMSPSMRIAFGLPSPDQHIGQTAHDFVQLAAQSNVMLLRSERQGETPTNPSRWLLRLQAVLKMLGAPNALNPQEPWHEWAALLDAVDVIEPCEAPAITVDPLALPSELSATNIELWMRDPYAFYAKTVLRLRALHDLDAEMTAMDRGNIFHDVLDTLAKTYPDHWPIEAQQRFIDLMKEGFAKHGSCDAEIHMMQPRLAVLAHNLWEFESERRAEITAFYSEKRGEMRLALNNYQPLLQAKADRIDLLPDDTLQISDYKTGKSPSQLEVKHALKPQLLVEAIIAANKGFSGLSHSKTSKVGYIDIGEGDKLLNDKKPIALSEGEIETVHQPGLMDFINTYLEEGTLYHSVPRPTLLTPAQDYARLARVAEWSKGEIEQEDA